MIGLCFIVISGTIYIYFRHTEKFPVFVNSPAPLGARISGIVVPHHDLVKKQRQALFEKMKQRFSGINQPKTVILLSPNHFNAGSAPIQVNKQTWDTFDGAILPQTDVIDTLIASKVAKSEPKSFGHEHGIKLILGDIKRTFPDARIVPIILKMGAKDADITRLHDALFRTCSACLMVASVDFSHYQPAALADFHDTLTLRALQNRDSATLLAKAEVDSPPALALLTRWAQSHKTEHFSLFDHTNSGVLAKDFDGETTTHIFGWYEEGIPVIPEDSVTFLMGGDMMFGRFVAYKYLKDGLEKIFSQFGDRVFWGTDAAIANLEGPISDKPVPGEAKPDNLVFNFPPQTIRALRFLRINGVSLANNHTYNQGSKGLAITRKLLEKAGIANIGDPNDVQEATVGSIQGEGMTLHIIAINALPRKVPDITSIIKKLKKAPQTSPEGLLRNQRDRREQPQTSPEGLSKVLIFPHWGTEYAKRHSKSQEQLAHAWIDAGADAVVGAHPHVIQDMESYKNRPIVYSMGNFVFDQFFSEKTQEGIFVAGRFTHAGLELFALPHRSIKMKPELMRGEKKKQLLEGLYADVKKHLRTKTYGKSLFFPYNEGT